MNNLIGRIRNKEMVKQYDVTREEVYESWQSVQAARGCAGVDDQSIEEIRADLDNQLYKIYNRMASGSYIPQAVKLVEIPKAKGGVRQLGIPTVTDRVAQGVIKNKLEKILESKFHPNSYGYRPNRSAIDAVSECRTNCFRYRWLLEVDIKGFFDNLDHDLCMQMLSKYTQDKTILLYSRKFLKAKGVREDGTEIEREKGTPQGGVVSPILANLYLHEAFDQWMSERFEDLKFERYADDFVIHCVSEKQAEYIKDLLTRRLKQFKLELHPEKTRIVYTGRSNDHDKRGHELKRSFTFLGYDFKPRNYKGKIVYTPGISKGALKRVRETIQKKWNLQAVAREFLEIADKVNPVIRGWINYYGHFRRSELYKLARIIDGRLVSHIKRKYAINRQKGWDRLRKIKEETPKLLCHWYMIMQEEHAG